MSGFEVTKAVTKRGRYYQVGERLPDPTPTEQSLARLYGWAKLPEVAADLEPDLGSLRKSELADLAYERGYDPTGLLKDDLIALLS